MAAIDLEELTQGKVHNLSGRLRGIAARERFGLDGLDGSGDPVEIRIPDYIYAVTPSFIQGLLGPTLKSLHFDVKAFRDSYRFVAPAVVLEQLERGISAITTSRDIAEIR
ncbi:hypothetical protein IP88_04235 [alpha proteobacterium AAP81b]|nr:hypothetical protein IP88_04235 [alpha proteobacterium AAP81b]